MSDIIFADAPKLKMRLIAWYAQREIAKNAKAYGLTMQDGKTVMEVIHDDLFNSPNPVIRKMHSKLIEAASHMGTVYHKATIIDIGSFALWICYKDTAYNQPTYWILNEFLNDEELKKELQYYVNKPEDWYCPRWQKTKDNTQKLRNKGLIDNYHLSKDEEIFVPQMQDKKWYDILNKDINNEIKKNNKI